MLFVGILSREPELFDRCETALSDAFGPVALRSERMSWDFTDYYRDEMGNGLLRMFLFFSRLIDPGDIAPIKVRTNRIEVETAQRPPSVFRRRINLDPGYLTEAKVVLATTKDYAHRVYVGKGIYAEVELQYDKKMGFLPVAHSYPDFRAASCRDLFGRARELLRATLPRE